jgi:FkbM family methyltransferase
MTLLMAKLVGPAGRVLAVEPGPPYVERLRANLALNSSLTDRVAVHQVGLSDAPGMLQWRPDPKDPWNAGLSTAHPDSRPGEVTVPVITLDALVASGELDRLDFIKIDVEGMELEVLRGARQTLEKLRPVLLLETMEMFRIWRRERTGIADLFAEIEGLLHELGYRLFALRPDGKLEEVTSASLPDNTLGIPIGHEVTSYASDSAPPSSS